MNSRLGKIAQLPKSIRDDLNLRLENGKQGPELLRWLNGLPETEQLLAEKFDHKPITAANLSDWRLGGFQDWRKEQAREARIQRLSESGASLAQAQSGDLFENFARIAVAELAADLDDIHDLQDKDARWQRLRELCRELARLQNSHNRSRWTDLAWTKRNDRLADHPSQPETQNPKAETASEPETPAPKTETEEKNFNPEIVPIRANSYSGIRYVHHAPCGCVCRKCHPKDGPYPYWDAERDLAARPLGSELIQRENGEAFHLHCWPCDCTCVRCDSKNRPEPPDQARKTIFRMIYGTKCNCRATCQKCHALDSEYPLTELLRHQALRKEQGGDFIRSPDGNSLSFRYSYCQCSCDQCQRTEPEPSQNLLTNTAPSPTESAL